MRLSLIEIENFKGIGTKQVIDMAPITLLFGPNSAGKSTILQSLHYLREILERNNPDPDQTIAGGLTDLGGFATLVHEHDLSLPIKIKVGIDLSEDRGSERLTINSGGAFGEADFDQLRMRYLIGENAALKEQAVVQGVGLGLEVRWSELIQAPYIAKLSVEIDGEAVAEIHSPAQEGRAQLTEFNFEHPLFRAVIDLDDPPESVEELLAEKDVKAEAGFRGDPFSTPLGNEIWSLSREISADAAKGETVEFRIAVVTGLGALPDLDRPLAVDLVEVDRDAVQRDYIRRPLDSRLLQTGELSRKINLEHARRRGLSALLDELVLGPVRIVRDYLRAMTYIGPLRDIPSRNYRPRLSPDESRWAQGLAAWDLLHTSNKSDLLNEVNDWLSSDERLRTGYLLEKIEFKEVPVPSAFHQLLQGGLEEDDLADLQELYVSLKTRTEIGLRDLVRGIVVAPSDVGVGVSQMVPVVVGCLRDVQGVLAIEQPELHVHPAIQVGIGDLFIRAIQANGLGFGSGKSLLIETHSEHIMLRLLRRIRETNDKELPPGVLGLEPRELSVIYVEGSDEGVRFRALRVDEEGEFLDHWPKGFFEERAGELF